MPKNHRVRRRQGPNHEGKGLLLRPLPKPTLSEKPTAKAVHCFTFLWLLTRDAYGIGRGTIYCSRLSYTLRKFSILPHTRQ